MKNSHTADNMAPGVLFCAFLCLFTGCGDPPSVREYREVVSSFQPSDRPQRGPISNDLFSQMPDDDIHAAFRSGGIQQLMPQDDIHAGLLTENSNMPDDDIHAGFKMPASMQEQNPELRKALEASVDRSGLTWTTPTEWEERPGDGMRLVTFLSRDASSPIECSIISLAGQAGGIPANVERWMRQIQLTPPKNLDQAIKEMERFQTKADLPAILVDLTLFQAKQSPEQPGIIAVIIESGDARIFVKQTGTKKDVIRHRQNLIDLANSIQTKN